MDPHHFKSFFNRGFVYDKLNNFSSAILDYNAAINISHNNQYAYYNRGITYFKLKQYDKAIEDFS